MNTQTFRTRGPRGRRLQYLGVLAQILVLIALMFSAVVLFARPVLGSDRPNVILCMADDQGWGDVAYNGHPVIKTPHLDAMSQSGLRFDHFYAAAPVCSPTRGSVMTGRNPNRFGCFAWGHPLRPQEITIAERMQQAGYATAHFGKWHLGSVLKDSPVSPGKSGFDQWLSAFNFYDNDPILSREGKAVEMKGESSIIAADAAIDFIKQQNALDKPFFAVVWFGSPHSPHRAAAEDLEHYQGMKDANWMGEITGLDRAVGKLRASLRELGIQDNTLFWYTSDNGGLKTASSGGRGKKGDIYEGGLRVPAIIEWPARIPSARATDIPAITSDIYPTLVDLLNLPSDNQPVLDGISLVPLIEGSMRHRDKPLGFWKTNQGGISTPHDQWMRQELAAQRAGRDYHDASRLVSDAGQIKQTFPRDRHPGHAAWTDWPWKLHKITKAKGQNERVRWELYNLSTDPDESTNIADDQPDRVASMQQALNQWLASVVDSLNGKDY